MSWASFNQTMAHVNDALQFGVDYKNGSGSIGDKLQKAGMNLFGNAMATENASALYGATGSNMGYMGKYAAKGDAQAALKNTTQASLYMAEMTNPYALLNSCRVGGCYGMNPGAYGIGATGLYNYRPTGGNPAFNVFNRNQMFIQNNYWR